MLQFAGTSCEAARDGVSALFSKKSTPEEQSGAIRPMTLSDLRVFCEQEYDDSYSV